MRILSQDGLIFNDIPYEKFVFGIVRDRDADKFCVVANKESTVSESGFPLNGVMAKYSTEAKARKAMEMLRNFNEVREVRNIPIKKDVIETMFEPLKKLFKIYTDGGGEFLKMDLVKVGDYFQFPADDEVEV